jgi:hypothetical protein
MVRQEVACEISADHLRRFFRSCPLKKPAAAVAGQHLAAKHRYGIFIPPGRPARQRKFFAAKMQTAFSTIARTPN